MVYMGIIPRAARPSAAYSFEFVTCVEADACDRRAQYAQAFGLYYLSHHCGVKFVLMLILAAPHPSTPVRHQHLSTLVRTSERVWNMGTRAHVTPTSDMPCETMLTL